jgi:hypothetical protein
VFPLLGFVFGIFVVLVLQAKSLSHVESYNNQEQDLSVCVGFDDFGVPWILSFLLGCGDFIFWVCGGLSADDVL